jgi:hydroxymethylglutaryl-CoA reductase (NADPH)
MPAIPTFVLKKLYVKGSLRMEDDKFALDLANSIAPAVITAFTRLNVDNHILDPGQVTLVRSNGDVHVAAKVSTDAPLPFPLGETITLRVDDQTLEPGPHEVTVHVVVQEVGPLEIPITDTLL